MPNFKLVIEYDGTNYHGWQRQKDLITIQEIIEKAIQKMTDCQISVIGSGRTDAGVHALKQVANFHCQTHLTPDIFYKGLNSLLPNDIVIKSCTQVEDSFHSRFNAKRKTYQYIIFNQAHRTALFNRYCYYVRKPLQIEAIENACKDLIGTYDYKSFQGGTDQHLSSTIRTVYQASIKKEIDGILVFSIEANGFLRYMVRTIVGTMIHIGMGQLPPDCILPIIQSRSRDSAGPTAPPQGLFLVNVVYDNDH